MSLPEARPVLSVRVCPRISHEQRYANAVLICCEYPHRGSLDFQGAAYKKSPSPTAIWKRDLKSGSKCAIIAHGIQASRVPVQIRFICREYASSFELALYGRSRGAYSFCMHLLYHISFEFSRIFCRITVD